MLYIIMLMLGLVIGLSFMYFVLRPKLKTTQKIEQAIQEQNNKLKQEKEELEKHIKTGQWQAKEIDDTRQYLATEVATLINKKEDLKKYLTETREQIDKDNEVIYQKSYDLMQERLSAAANEESKKFQKAREEAEKNYLETLDDIAKETAAALAMSNTELEEVNQKLETMRAKADAAIAAAKREEEKQLEIDKYKILVTEADLLEINRLKEIAPYFRNARAIYKILWESYYRNLTTEMINRVIGTGTHTGIYKITNTKNQKIYIGQAVKYRPMKNFSL